MENHKRILGILYIISGVFQILGMIFITAMISAFLPFILEQAEGEGAGWVLAWIVPFMRVISIVVIVFFAIPAVVGGWGLLNKKAWAMMVVLILGCFKLFSFPIGTALGIYTIWVYLENNKKPQQA
jgi:hypothetical protein